MCHLQGQPAPKGHQQPVLCALSPRRQHEIAAVKQLQEEAAGQAEALGLELQKATKQLEDASKHVRGSPAPSVQGSRRCKGPRGRESCVLFGMVRLPARVEPAEEVKFEGVVTTVC